jgi:TolA-binding protein
MRRRHVGFLNLGRRLIWIFGMLPVGCAYLHSNSLQTERTHVRQLQVSLKRKDAELEMLKEKNLILSQRLMQKTQLEQVHQPPVPFQQSAAFAMIASDTTNSESGSLEPVQENLDTGEHFLYSKILDSFKKQSAPELNKTITLLQKSYPQSVFLDNALYLRGTLLRATGQRQEALEQMQELISQFPQGNKVTAALLSKGEILQELGRNKEAQDCWTQVLVNYPGSPEAKSIAAQAGNRKKAQPQLAKSLPSSLANSSTKSPAQPVGERL